MKRILSCLILLPVALAGGGTRGAIRPADVFGDNMVLQAGRPAIVWGTGSAGETATVAFGERTVSAAVTADGTWRVKLPAMPADATPRRLVVADRVFTNVIVGEVWICAGQSNMRFPVESATGAREAIAGAKLPNIRLLDFTGRIYPDATRYPPDVLATTTATNYYTSTGWRPCCPATVPSFSAVAYYFGRALHDALGVPIGLIHNAVGGVPMESYIPIEAMQADPQLRHLLSDAATTDRRSAISEDQPLNASWLDNPRYPAWCRERARLNLAHWFDKPAGPLPHHPFEPGFLFDAGMRPLVPFALRGFIWYQGESNATVDGGGGPAVPEAVNRHTFETLIQSWRRAWATQLPFLFVQLPGLNRDWAPFREMQDGVDREVPDTAMAVTIDVGDPANVHPRNKQPVGDRLALLALRDVYGREVVASGPRYRDYRLRPHSIVIEFDETADGLRTRDGGSPTGFRIAGESRRFHPALAVIHEHAIEVSSPAVPAPVAVRYAWEDDPRANLVNSAGLPAAPFRTDGWRPERLP